MGHFRPRFGVRLAQEERLDDGDLVWAASTGDWGSGRCSPRRRRLGVAGVPGLGCYEGLQTTSPSAKGYGK
jgi:hypothetical protein